MIDLRLISLISIICSIIVLSLSTYSIGIHVSDDNKKYYVLSSEISAGIIFISLLILYFVY